MKNLIAFTETEITCFSMKYILTRKANTLTGVEYGIALFETEAAANNVAKLFNEQSRNVGNPQNYQKAITDIGTQDYTYAVYRLSESLFSA